MKIKNDALLSDKERKAWMKMTRLYYITQVKLADINIHSAPSFMMADAQTINNWGKDSGKD